MLKIAIVGCGKIADVHAAQIKRIPRTQLVGVCDNEILMAEQLGQRYGITACFTSVHDLLKQCRPDVVHITTPPQSHHSIAKTCLEHGAHVYVEKPFTLFHWEAEELIACARRNSRKLTVGHDMQFTHSARRMRQLVNNGYLGGPPVHMESYYCYQFSGRVYGKALLADKNHWVRRLPGGLLQNIISHGIAKLAEFIQSDTPGVSAHGYTSPSLRAIGEDKLVDELRVVLTDGDQRTAYFTFSSQFRPALHQFRLYGASNALVLDDDNETLIRMDGRKYKSYLSQFVPPLVFAREYVRNAYQNLRLFMARDFHPKAGMKFLMEAFYDSIRTDSPVPIPYREILLTARIMDQIFAQVGNTRVQEVQNSHSGIPEPRQNETLQVA